MRRFSLTLSDGTIMKGHHFPVPKGTEAVANFCFITGMQEYGLRYKDLAAYLNSRGINVWVLDHFGQGANVEKVEDQMKWEEGAFEKGVEGIHLMIELAKKNGLPTTQGGHSMGSFFTQRRLQRYPGDCEKTLIIGSNGGQAFLMKMGYTIAKLTVNKKNWDKPNPTLTSLGLGSYAKAVKDRKTDIDWLSIDEENVRAYAADPYCGYPPTSGFWKEFLKGMSKLWDKKPLSCVSKDEKILLIAGAEDPVGQKGKGVAWLANKYKALGVKDVTLKLYPKLRHEIHNEVGKEEVWRDFADFILA